VHAFSSIDDAVGGLKNNQCSSIAWQNPVHHHRLTIVANDERKD
jgi:hypothetical protein